MFESAELGRKVSREDYSIERPDLREALLEAQFRLAEKKCSSVVIVLAGVEAAGKGDTANVFAEWLDVRGIRIHATPRPSDDDLQRPPLYRFWKRLPAKGEIAVFLGSWYTFPLIDYAFKKIDKETYERGLHRIRDFESMLVAEGVLVLKFWLHLSKKQQRKRLKKLSSDPETSWRVDPRDWEYHRHYDRFRNVAEYTLRKTSTGDAPWMVVEASNARHRRLNVARALRKALDTKLDATVPPRELTPDRPLPDEVNIIRSLDLTQTINPETYDGEFRAMLARLGLAARRLASSRCSVVLVFEGSDAAGKGGAIRRLMRALDARFTRVISIAAPSDEELARPYLWRFWRNIPKHGRTAIFDRSWYGRVLVERIEGFAKPADWQRAFAEINSFEAQLVDAGAIVQKFWLSISEEEQLRRFKAREETGFKRYKLTDEDWRNREKWQNYEAAAAEMISRTSNRNAPWTLIEAEDKRYSRLKVLTTVVGALEDAIGDGRKKKRKKKKKK